MENVLAPAAMDIKLAGDRIDGGLDIVGLAVIDVVVDDAACIGLSLRANAGGVVPVGKDGVSVVLIRGEAVWRA